MASARALVLAPLLLAAAASADEAPPVAPVPIGDGVALVIQENGPARLVKGAVRVPVGLLVPDWRVACSDPKSCDNGVKAAYDPATAELTLTVPWDRSFRVPRAQVIATFVRAQAWEAELDGDAARAAERLATAATVAPGPRPLLEGASLRLAAGDRDGAAALLAQALAGDRIAALAALFAETAYAPVWELLPPGGGSAHLDGPAVTLVARAGDLVAATEDVERPERGNCGDGHVPRARVLTVSGKGGAVRARLPIGDPDGVCVAGASPRDLELARLRLRAANRFLAVAGFAAGDGKRPPAAAPRAGARTDVLVPPDVRVDLTAGTLRRGAVEVSLGALFPPCEYEECDDSVRTARYVKRKDALEVNFRPDAPGVMLPRAHVVAVVAVAEAHAAELRGDLARAEERLAAALALEPTDATARDLAAVQLERDARDRAVATLAPLVARDPAVALGTIASDRLVAPLLPALAPGVATTPGHARVGGLRRPFVAFAGDRFAAIDDVPLYDGCTCPDNGWSERRLLVQDLAGKRLASLPFFGSQEDCAPDRWHLDDAPEARLRAGYASAYLEALGFEVPPDLEHAWFTDNARGVSVARFPRSGLGFALTSRDEGIILHLLRGDTTVDEHVVGLCRGPDAVECDMFAPRWAAISPSRGLVVVSVRTHAGGHTAPGYRLVAWRIAPQ